MFKCIQVEHGVDISYGGSFFFTFKSKTHNLINLPDGRVRISRKIDNAIEFVSEPYERFVSLDGQPVGTTYAELSAYMNHDVADLKAGEGVSVTGDTVSIVAGGPSTLGGFKVGTGLVVDGQGRLSANAVSEVTKVLNTQAERLALTAEPLRPYRIIQLDTKRLYYLNAGDSPSVSSNWFTGPSIETTVLSFKGRTGALDSEFGDYNFDLIPMTDKTTSATHKLVIDDGMLFIEDIESTIRTQIAYSTDVDMGDVYSKLTSLDDTINSQSDGLVKKVSDINTKVNSIEDVVSNATTGLNRRVVSLEQLVTTVNQKADSVADNNVVLDTRLISVESELLNKAPLVNGKIPYANLPDLAAGRKVNVANRAARLQLSRHPDLTIAYESDTAEAWALNANDNPAIDSNWSKLGDAQSQGVASFNGRTGAIGPQQGDYNTGQISEILGKEFVTAAQKTEWSAKETPTGAQTKATAAQTAAKTYADSTFIPVTQKNAVSGLAPLDANKRVPVANLPTFLPQKARKWVDVKASRFYNTWWVNGSGNDMEVFLRTNALSDNAKYIIVNMRENSTSPTFGFQCTYDNATGNRYLSHQVTVPAGWQYAVLISGGAVASDISAIGVWRELS
jgi:hypothetical protein